MSIFQALYPLIPVAIAGGVALKSDVYSNSGVFTHHRWPFSNVLIILTGLAVIQFISYFAFRFNIISAHILGVYGAIFFLFTAGTLAYFFVIKKFKVDVSRLCLSSVKNINYILVPVLCFFVYSWVSILYVYVTNNDQIVSKLTKTIVDLKIFNDFSTDTFVYVLSLVLVAPVTEEIIFRGIFFAPFERKLGSNGAILTISILWAFTHLSFSNIFKIFIFGLVFGYIYKKTESLVPGIILHSLINSFPIIVYIFLRE